MFVVKIFPDNMVPEFLSRIIENSHDAFLISDPDMKILFANGTAERIFGYEKNALNGIPIMMLMPEERRNNYLYDIESALKGLAVSNIDSGTELLGQRKNGEVFPIELTYMCYNNNGKNFFVSQIRDISDRINREKELSVVSNALRIITEANRILIRAENETEFAQSICDIITGIGGYSKSLIILVEHNGEERFLLPIAFSGYENRVHIEESLVVSMAPECGSPTRITIDEKRTDVCRNIKARGLWKYWKNSPDEMEFDSTISVPIIDKGSVIGVLRVFSNNPFSFDNHEVKLLEELAADISHGLTVLRERKELKTTTTALRVLTEANRILTEAENEKDYLNDICRIIIETGGFVRTVIHTVENIEDNDKLIRNGGSIGFGDHEVSKIENFKLSRIKNSRSPTVIAINEKRVNICENISARGLWKYWKDKAEDMDFESTIAVPVVSKNDVIALIRIYSDDPFYFTKDKVKLLEDLSNDIAHGLNYIRTKGEKRNSEIKYRTLFENSSDGIYLADAETGIIFDANKKTEDIIGLPADSIIGLKYSDLHTSGAGDVFENVIEDLLGSRCDSSSIEAFIRPSGRATKAIPVQINASTIMMNGKKIIQIIFRDISVQKAHEENIRNIQKMEALGTLSGGIAHDINNILSPVIGFTQIALLETEDRIKQMNCLNEVLTAAGRAKELVSQILTFCRKSETEKKPFTIQGIVKEILKLISSSVPENVKLETVIEEDCGHIICDPIQIYQILINLCTNALYAMRETGGVLKICLVKKGSSEIKIEKTENIPFEDYICLIVSDTGCGMTKTTLNRIFEPYFTTKPKGEGTGLGLSVVSGIVKEHGAEMHIRTYPGEGTYFKITFPTSPVLQKSGNTEHDIRHDTNKTTVMVIDDEPQITFMMKLMLEELGYSAVTFTDPVKALEEFKISPEKYGLVITDQTMPRLTGTDLSKAILSVRPHIPIILNTGFSPIASRSECKKIGIKEFIMKPITIADLSAVLERALKEN
jgi:PAS domain S-box-containing protein